MTTPRDINLHLSDDVADELGEIAHAERRRPRDQALVMLIAAIRRATRQRRAQADRRDRVDRAVPR